MPSFKKKAKKKVGLSPAPGAGQKTQKRQLHQPPAPVAGQKTQKRQLHQPPAPAAGQKTQNRRPLAQLLLLGSSLLQRRNERKTECCDAYALRNPRFPQSKMQIPQIIMLSRAQNSGSHSGYRMLKIYYRTLKGKAKIFVEKNQLKLPLVDFAVLCPLWDPLCWARENQLRHDDLRTLKSAKAIEQFITLICKNQRKTIQNAVFRVDLLFGFGSP